MRLLLIGKHPIKPHTDKIQSLMKVYATYYIFAHLTFPIYQKLIQNLGEFKLYIVFLIV